MELSAEAKSIRSLMENNLSGNHGCGTESTDDTKDQKKEYKGETMNQISSSTENDQKPVCSTAFHGWIMSKKKDPGGWKTMPFILGNEVCDKLAAIGLLFSMILYLTKEFHLDQVVAVNILTISGGTGYITPIIGGYIADSFLGRYRTLIISSCINLVGMSLVVLTAAVPSLRPAPCSSPDDIASQCPQASPLQLFVLYLGFTLMAIASGGIRPCSYPFGADQFKQDTIEGKKAFQSYSNWYFFNIYLTVIISGTLVVYVQQKSWPWGFAIPTIAMALAILFFVMGTPFYRYETPAGTPLKEIARVCAAAFFKRKLTSSAVQPDALYDPALDTKTLDGEKYAHTEQFRFLDKAAVVGNKDIDGNGKVLRPWKLCSVHQVEQMKIIIRTLPIMIACMLHALAVSQQTSFSVLQANIMYRHVAGKFNVPAASMGVFAMIMIMISLPFYDKVVLPYARKVTGTVRGITFLQRIGFGYVMGICAMVLSGIVEAQRRHVAVSHGLIEKPNAVVPMSVFWLVPQLSMMGIGEAFTGVGQSEFFYDQVPESMRSTVGSINSCISGIGVYVSAVVLTAVQKLTARHGHVSWLDNNLNKARLDRYYYIVAGLIGFNFLYFLIVSNWYTYKNVILSPEGKDSDAETGNDMVQNGSDVEKGCSEKSKLAPSAEESVAKTAHVNQM